MSTQSNSKKAPSQFSPRGSVGNVEKPKNFKKTMTRLLSYLKPFRILLLAIIVLSIIAVVLSTFTPFILGEATNTIADGVLSGQINADRLSGIIIFLLVLYVLSSTFRFLSESTASSLSQKVVYKLRSEIKDKLDRLPINYYDKTPTGDVLSRITNDVDTISSTLQQSITQIINGVFQLIGIIVFMLIISVYMTLIALLLLPIFMFVSMKIAKISQKQFIAQQKTLGELNSHIEEIYSGHTVVKLYNHENAVKEKFDDINVRLVGVGQKAQFISGLIMPAINFINNIGFIAVCVLGGVLAGNGSLSIGGIQSFVQYMQQFSQPISQTASIANVLQSTMAASERVFELLDETEMEVDEIAEENYHFNLEEIRGDIEFKNVCFSYSKDKPLIENLSIKISASDSVAIVGPTGAGKTTLVNLLLRFYEINSGEILIDGRNIDTFKRSDLLNIFGMVLQDTWLFSGTIADNIGFGKNGSDIKDIKAAAEKAYISHYIETLPNGYDEEINEENSNISLGQKQLLTIARAIVSDSKVLILDEATSSVDTRTESYIQTAMNKMIENKTNFVIAHRLSTIKNADIILVMNKGSVIEIGNHKDLLAKKGFYFDLYNSQFNNVAI